ncbi:uncharacterized protein LOC111223886 [Seriola dumerili]|uniref:uncharacterized protein LOC111223886 n=1 Tax=Seriola dumerili TaxID=41447 RepID=UPI000BBEA391|nr:uncharacterized protein LOC111223886 [Seriola dumerili]
MEQHGGSMSVSEGSPKQPKSRSGPEFLGLSRCAGCYNQKASSMPRWGGDGESSSSAEDSGPEVDCESESESTSSSSCSGPVEAETPETERSSPVCGGEDGAGREETGETSSQRQQDENKKRRMIQRAPLVKSFSLPSSFTPNLTPLSFLPRPPGVVSTLHLEVLPEKHSDNTFVTIRRHLSERESTGCQDNISNPETSPSRWRPGESQRDSSSGDHEYLNHYFQQLMRYFSLDESYHVNTCSLQGC